MTKTYYLTSSAEAIGAYVSEVENAGSTSAPGSGTVSSTVVANAASTNEIAWSSPSAEPNVGTWPTGDYHMVVDINAIGANTTLSSNTVLYRIASDLSATVVGNSGTWDSNTGTGVKTHTVSAWSPTGSTASDRYNGLLKASNSSMTKDQTLTLNLGASTYIDGPWTAGPATSLLFRRPFRPILR